MGFHTENFIGLMVHVRRLGFCPFAPLLTQTGATKFRHGNAESEIKTSSNNIRTWQNCFRNIVSRFGYNFESKLSPFTMEPISPSSRPI